MARLFARTIAPRDRLDFDAAIGARAARIVQRVCPFVAPPHGFADFPGFIESCRRSSERTALHHALIARLHFREASRGRARPTLCGIRASDIPY